MYLPIIVMTRNEEYDLEVCINTLRDKLHSKIAYKIFIVDNNSNNNEHIKLLNKYKNYNDIQVFFNNENKWILGINKYLDEILKDSNGYFFLTDGDIDFSIAPDDIFEYLISTMNKNCCIGKIGISLDWSFLQGDVKFNSILKQEKELYNENRKINELYISPVDTTAAIYRVNWSFSGDSKFYPDHIRYLKPELYSCRTPRDILVRHIGWEHYFNKNISCEDINEKVKCFTFVSGFLKSEIVDQASIKMRVFNKILWKPINIFWVFRRYYFLMKYVLVKGRRKFENF
ncbi:glycosyltransferase family A protein [Photobacterium leiognathi]|uniref:glycosyltransferase family A protein n=1 Tax=Photobacterium leiognathi TaxID=553611 RepID=UPI002980D19E|nr:glycosyltransferase family A protein [Photobacterium leiognathi]